jgi:hypothetical protein
MKMIDENQNNNSLFNFANTAILSLSTMCFGLGCQTVVSEEITDPQSSSVSTELKDVPTSKLNNMINVENPFAFVDIWKNGGQIFVTGKPNISDQQLSEIEEVLKTNSDSNWSVYLLEKSELIKYLRHNQTDPEVSNTEESIAVSTVAFKEHIRSNLQKLDDGDPDRKSRIYPQKVNIIFVCCDQESSLRTLGLITYKSKNSFIPITTSIEFENQTANESLVTYKANNNIAESVIKTVHDIESKLVSMALQLQFALVLLCSYLEYKFIFSKGKNNYNSDN